LEKILHIFPGMSGAQGISEDRGMCGYSLIAHQGDPTHTKKIWLLSARLDESLGQFMVGRLLIRSIDQDIGVDRVAHR
jgi:hypothetical protein